MKILIPSAIAFAVSYFLLRSFKTQWEKGKLARPMRFPLGVLAWVVVLSFGAVAYGLAQPVIELFVSPSNGVAFQIVGYALAVTVLWKYSAGNPELFDFPHMKLFIKESLAFDDPSRRRNEVFQDLEKHEIQRVYREVTGRDPLADHGETDRRLGKTLKSVTGREFREDGRARMDQREVGKLLAQPVESPALAEELRQLEQGSIVDIADSWKINSMKCPPHDWHKFVSEARIDPKKRILGLDLRSETFQQSRLMGNEDLYRFKQDLYDFFQALYQQDWMKPYLKYASVITCRCCNLSVDAFEGQTIVPLLQVEISLDLLQGYSNKFFNVGEMRSELLFRHG